MFDERLRVGDENPKVILRVMAKEIPWYRRRRSSESQIAACGGGSGDTRSTGTTVFRPAAGKPGPKRFLLVFTEELLRLYPEN